mmetsp:Transcript_33943/g.38630  ORF Transcript_33943/g.38630 Transcript_33943/m.38630 type:complete len:80 (-) Transcript_33943:1170-1409(-)
MMRFQAENLDWEQSYAVLVAEKYHFVVGAVAGAVVGVVVDAVAAVAGMDSDEEEAEVEELMLQKTDHSDFADAEDNDDD